MPTHINIIEHSTHQHYLMILSKKLIKQSPQKTIKLTTIITSKMQTIATLKKIREKVFQLKNEPHQITYKSSIKFNLPNQPIKPTQRKFSLDLFKTCTDPTIISTVNPKTFERNSNLWAMDLPIKMPHSDLMVPTEFNQFTESIEKICQHQKSTGEYDNWYAYLCIDQRTANPGSSQRRPGEHADSFPTGNVSINRPSDTIYLAYNAIPTEFCYGNFTFTSNIDTSDNKQILNHFSRQTVYTKIFNPYTILKMDTGHVHRVGINTTNKPINRTFLKLTFSPDIFNRVGNDHNYLFDYNWPLYSRTVERNNSSIIDGYVNDHDFRFMDTTELMGLLDDDTLTCTRNYHKAEIKPAIPGELLMTNNSKGEFMTCLVAKIGDFKVHNNKTDMTYFLPWNKLVEFYEVDTLNELSMVFAKPLMIKAKLITECICLMAPWGAKQYLRPGDYLIQRHNGEIYGIDSNDLLRNYH